MQANFMTSETRENLMRAFAGESQARNRYTFAASEARKQDLYLLYEVFCFTAGQEKEHAEIFYEHLKTNGGGTVSITASYPVDDGKNLATLLRAAQHNEYEEASPIYPTFAETARKEGFPAVAASFDMIAKIEKLHGERFALFASMLENGTLFSAKEETEYLCLNCGHVHRGKDAPVKCPVCQHAQGYFIPLSLAPYSALQLSIMQRA